MIKCLLQQGGSAARVLCCIWGNIIDGNMCAEESPPLYVAEAERLVKIYTSGNYASLLLDGHIAGLFKISRAD